MTLEMAVRWTMALALVAGTATAQEDSTTKKRPPEAPAVSQPQPAGKSEPVIRNRKDNISYAMGLDLARSLKRQKDELNIDLLLRAVTDSLADKPLLMTDEQATAILKRLDAEQRQDFAHAKMMLSDKNKKAGETFFIENAKKPGVVTLPSGLQYKVLKQGNGSKPTLDDRVVCQFRGTLLDGTEFDSSEKRGHALSLPVKGVIKGWTEALQLMPVGSKWQLYIPPQLAYGDRGLGPIGPDAMLIFDLELISIEKPAPAKADAVAKPAAVPTSNPNPAKVEQEPKN